MLTLGTVRTALLSDQPWSRLDELVRAELASGRTTRQIYKSLMGMAGEIDATPDLTEDASDALGDVLDALTGYCRSDCQYKDPPNTKVPTEEEIAELPRWARVAFAARCARRVLTAFDSLFLDTKPRVSAEIETAVMFAEQNAGNLLIPALYYASAEEYLREAPGTVAEFVVAAALTAAESVTGENTTAFHAMRYATSVATESDFLAAFRRDFDHLSRLAEWQHWTDDTPVPPEVFGPLWPEGPPKSWPPITDAPPRTDLVVEAFARERATERMIEDDIVNLFNALNRYHIARNGVRLTLEQFQSLLPAFVPAEA
ncbi:hypothetical protein [Frigoriglobus tundricola]|uniref:Uncharacterized protein n=1 Tax=Frigoriglobus tundricola TaxID=2774151 RepID=A0A6M5YM14_9BACT|nr:hypothetical protein [Frigoriglobus tundricola]QJW94291.1 hypothetical protein FTUN_1811 [Frigoriglobus tundricola]